MVLEMQKAVLPQMAENVAKPMSQIGDVTIYGTSGNEMSGLSNNVPTVMKQTFDLVKDATGVDMSNIVMANSLDAKVNKNINLNGQVDVE